MFPLNSSDDLYHFRFKVRCPDYGYVWSDVTSPSDIVPLYDGYIVVKVLNLNNLKTSQRKSRLRLKAVSGVPQKTFSTSNVSTTSKQSVTNAPRNSAVSPTSSSVAAPTQTKPANQSAKQPAASVTLVSAPAAPATANLFDYDDAPSPNLPTQATVKSPPIVKPTPVVEQDLFTFDEPPVQSQPKVTTSKPSTALQNAAAAAGVNIDENPTANLSRAELKSLHKAEIDDKVKRALENKQEVDDMQRKEAQELDIVSVLFFDDVTFSSLFHSISINSSIKIVLHLHLETLFYSRSYYSHNFSLPFFFSLSGKREVRQGVDSMGHAEYQRKEKHSHPPLHHAYSDVVGQYLENCKFG